jgi:hypothetical protein
MLPQTQHPARVSRPAVWPFSERQKYWRRLHRGSEFQRQHHGELKAPIPAIIGGNEPIVSNLLHTHQLNCVITNMPIVELSNTSHAPHQTNTSQVIAHVNYFMENF